MRCSILKTISTPAMIAKVITLPADRCQLVERAPDAASTLVENVRIDHGGAHVAVAQQFLDRPESYPDSSRWVAKEWRSV